MTPSPPFVSWDNKYKTPLVQTLKADWFKVGTALLIFQTVLLLIHTSMGMFDNSLIVPSKTHPPTHRKEVSAKIKRHLASIVTR